MDLVGRGNFRRSGKVVYPNTTMIFLRGSLHMAIRQIKSAHIPPPYSIAKLVDSNILSGASLTRRWYSDSDSDSDYDNKPKFAGCYDTKWMTKVEIQKPEQDDGMPIYTVLDDGGNIVQGAEKPDLSKDELVTIYRKMVLLNSMDNIMYDAQRQGLVSFYMTNHGEEAAQMGSAAALHPKDMIWGQYREAGVLMYRGFKIDQFLNQCFGNIYDGGKGRQMPVHYGSTEFNFVTISSTLATQIPQAVGAAYSYKMQRNGQCVVCYFGDGAASEGDAHGGFNFAAVLDCPIIFICRNNGFAISVPVHEQYRGDGIASRGVGYGIATIRVNGNDVFAMYNAVKAAREIAVGENRPVLVEAMTYRIGHHSTSDNSSAYRSVDEVTYWEKDGNPTKKLEKYLINQGWWTAPETEELLAESRRQVVQGLKAVTNVKLHSPSEAFRDVYAEMPPRIQRQHDETKRHCLENPDKYPLDRFEPFQ